MSNLFLWHTDTHLGLMPWTKVNFIYRIIKDNPKAIFLTGDISTGMITPIDLAFLASCVKCPIYFVLGNHDYYFSSFSKIHDKVRRVCEEYPNLIWLTESEPIEITKEKVLIGTEGWYDASFGNPKYLRATFDWIFIEELRCLPSMSKRIEKFKELSQQSCVIIENKLKKCVEKGYKEIYILTHFPPWKESTHHIGTFFEKFWLPYNVNGQLGKTIEDIMKYHKEINVIVLAGHTHKEGWASPYKNVRCHVGAGNYHLNIENENYYSIK